MRRALLIGCPRSGTTLLQTMIGAHPAVFTVPETHYFSKIRGRLEGHSVGRLVSPRSAARSLDALAEASSVARPDVPRWWPTAGRYIASFTTVLDEAARVHGAEVWIEKSPIHLHHLDEITAGVPEPRFIHLIRDGRDVVASLVDLCERDPERWVGQLLPRNSGMVTRLTLVEAATRRWNGDLERSLQWLDQPRHLVLRYEALLDRTRATLQSICDFLEIPYSEAMERHWEAAGEIVGPRSELMHMEKTFQPLEDRRLQRFSTLFSPEQQASLSAALTHGGDPLAAIEHRRG